jgi:putative 2OG-Fe(II) oxygenase
MKFMETEKSIFVKNGYSVIKKNFFSATDIDRIEEILDKLIESQNSNLEIDKNVCGGKSVVLQNFVDENLELKEYINKIFENKEIISKIKNYVGDNFKIRDIAYRVSYPGDTGLGLHQDGDGENNLVLNLGKLEDSNGKTCFIKSSHQFSSIKKIINRDSISYRLNKISKFFLDFVDYSRGSILMFDNKVWHGRFPNKAKIPSKALLVGIWKEGSTINYEPKKNFFKKNMNKLDLKKYELDRKRFLKDNLVETISSDSYYIIPSNKKKNKDFLIKNRSFKTMIYVILIKLIYFFKRV